ncbi:MAG: hypothetical protein ABII82_07965 [Verrucomicrobiota bacterium]
MSEEESSPAPLRLKPRQRPPADSPAPGPEASTPPPPSSPPPPVAAGPEPTTEPAERPRLRAKPRLTVTEDTAAADPAAPPPVSGPPTSPTPAGEPEPEPAPLKLRLQPPSRSADTPLPPLPAEPLPTPPASASPLPPVPVTPPLPPPASSPDDGDLPPPLPAAPASADDDLSLRPPDHIVPHISAPQPLKDIEKQMRAPVPASALRKKKSPLKAIVILCTVLLAVSAGFWFAGNLVYKQFFAEEVAKLPGKLVEKAHAVVEDQRALEQARIDALGEGREPAGDRAIGPAPSPTAAPAPIPAEEPVTAYAPETPETTAVPAEGTDVVTASPQFIAFVEAARIGGVFQGSPSRAFINGRTVRAGDTVDERLGVVFVGLDDTRRRLIFRDATGAEIIRKF